MTHSNFFERPYQGRISRPQFLIGFVLGFIGIVIGIVLTAALQTAADDLWTLSVAAGTFTSFLVFLALMFLGLSAFFTWGLLVRRWHDIGVSGWCIVFNIIPLLNIIAILALFFMPGNKEGNDYGPKIKSFNIFRILFNTKNEWKRSSEYFDICAPIGVLVVMAYLYFYWLPL